MPTRWYWPVIGLAPKYGDLNLIGDGVMFSGMPGSRPGI